MSIVTSFQVRIEAISPVHVGSGETVLPKMQFYNPERRRLTVASLEKLLAKAAEHPYRPNALTVFFEDDSRTLRDMLTDWKVFAKDIAAYSLVADEAAGELRAFIRVGIGSGEGTQAYLPGSSLKGALRSAIARSLYLADDDLREQLGHDLAAMRGMNERGDGRFLRDLRAAPERRIFGDRPSNSRVGDHSNYDLMRLLQVGDALIEPAGMRVCAVEIVSSQQDDTLKTKFQAPTWIEAMGPGAVAHSHMRFLDMLTQPQAAQALTWIQQHQDWVRRFWRQCCAASQDLIQQEIAFYDAHPNDDRAIELGNWFEARLAEVNGMAQSEQPICLLPLGWGSGYDAKTISDLVEESTFESMTEVFRNTRRLGRPTGSNEWMGNPRVPKTRKITQVDGHWYPLGWVKLQKL